MTGGIQATELDRADVLQAAPEPASPVCAGWYTRLCRRIAVLVQPGTVLRKGPVDVEVNPAMHQVANAYVGAYSVRLVFCTDVVVINKTNIAAISPEHPTCTLTCY